MKWGDVARTVEVCNSRERKKSGVWEVEGPKCLFRFMWTVSTHPHTRAHKPKPAEKLAVCEREIGWMRMENGEEPQTFRCALDGRPATNASHFLSFVRLEELEFFAFVVVMAFVVRRIFYHWQIVQICGKNEMKAQKKVASWAGSEIMPETRRNGRKGRRGSKGKLKTRNKEKIPHKHTKKFTFTSTIRWNCMCIAYEFCASVCTITTGTYLE